MAEETRAPINKPNTSRTGPFLAKVVSHLDPTYMGTLEVELMREVGNDSSESSQVIPARYLSPFYGVTSIAHNGPDPNDYNNTQKSYGMWFIPPDVGTVVVVMFIDGNIKNAYWIGCVPDERMNFMIPGYASTKYVEQKTKDSDLGAVERLPTAEYNKKIDSAITESNHIPKPVHPFQNILKRQGLVKDDIRGITTSSARREVPSMVFGISTPGPVDKSNGAKKGVVGKAGQIPNAFVSRLGGSSFVMDDGDDKFLRKGPAATHGPVYAAVEQNESGGDVGIPHNELIRLRTRTGHQILMHNSEDLIYIGNARGTTWIELTSNGKIDIFAEDSISIHTKNDLNVTADRDINLSSTGNFNVNAGGNVNLTAAGTSNFHSGGNHIETAAQIHMNGVGAAVAPVPSRVPQHEPWVGHENLDPTKYTPEQSKAVKKGADTGSPPPMYQKYTTSVDTFSKLPPPSKGKT